jgi:phosphate starvation-inducible PhoH-like protein
MEFDKRAKRRDKRKAKLEESVSYQVEQTYHVKAPTALNDAQQQYLNAIYGNIITFGVGCAGTGKSYIALSYAAQQLQLKNITKIIICRPIVEAGESLGYLKGELSDKTEPWMLPMIEILSRRLGKPVVDYYLNKKMIEFKPLAYMRGVTFTDSVVILDEAQNTSVEQMRMFLTRVGEGCKIIIDGDVNQCDISCKSGLKDAMNRLQNVNNIQFCYFTIDDVVRSGICRDILLRYNN